MPSINPTFQTLIPPLSEDESAQLEENIKADGCRDPLVTWDDKIVDGHNRFRICTENDIPFTVVEREFEDEGEACDWIIRNQFGRRNLTPFSRAELALKLEPLLREKARERQATSTGGANPQLVQNSAQAGSPGKTRADLAKVAGVSHDTIAKAKVIEREADEKTKQQLREGSTTINKVATELKQRRQAEEHKARLEVAPVSSGTVTNLDELAGQKFGTIYADPPWRYNNQGTRGATDNHYSTMSIDDICAMPIAELAADKAHLHLWVTNAFLFDAPRVLEAWGFEYRSTFVWVKPQIGMGNYWRNSHEIMITGIRGGQTAISRRERSWIEHKRGKHSAKPEAVRESIERLSPGPYLELFGRKPAEGWTVFGNEVRGDLVPPAMQPDAAAA